MLQRNTRRVDGDMYRNVVFETNIGFETGRLDRRLDGKGCQGNGALVQMPHVSSSARLFSRSAETRLRAYPFALPVKQKTANVWTNNAFFVSYMNQRAQTASVARAGPLKREQEQQE